MKVSAQLNNLRRSPRKVRLVADLLKGSDVKEAENQLKFLVKGSALEFEKLLRSAVSNAENNFGLDKNNLFIKDVIVGEGVKMKRWLPRAHGRASLLLKRTSLVKIVLEELIEGKGRKKVEKQKISDAKEAKGVRESKKPEREVSEKDSVREETKKSPEQTIEKEKEIFGDKRKGAETKGFLKRVFRRKSM